MRKGRRWQGKLSRVACNVEWICSVYRMEGRGCHPWCRLRLRGGLGRCCRLIIARILSSLPLAAESLVLTGEKGLLVRCWVVWWCEGRHGGSRRTLKSLSSLLSPDLQPIAVAAPVVQRSERYVGCLCQSRSCGRTEVPGTNFPVGPQSFV